MKKLNDKTVLITGAASGIGKLMALRFAQEGSRTALVDVNSKGIRLTEKDVSKTGSEVRGYLCDITKQKEVVSTIKNVKKDFKHVDILVNNAGIVCGKNFLDMTFDEFKKTMEVNFFGHAVFTRLILPDMIDRNSGHIVNIASSAGFLGMPRMTDYNASKFAEVGFSDALRRELKKQGCEGVKLTCVCPYVINTGMFKGFNPLRLNPVLKPEYVADRIVDAVKREKPYLLLPGSVYLTLILRLLPVIFQDWMVKIMGASNAMDNYIGRGQEGGNEDIN